MEIYIRDGTGACPCCSGMIYPEQLHRLYRCNDCKALFKAYGAGYDKYGVLVDKVAGQSEALPCY